jgi:hypothetical protein
MRSFFTSQPTPRALEIVEGEVQQARLKTVEEPGRKSEQRSAPDSSTVGGRPARVPK